MIQFIENISVLSDGELIHYSSQLARYENEIGLRIIACLREAEKRMLYCQVGMSSLWEYATRYLGLSNGNAQMKIDAMRLGRDHPAAKEKIESGELSIPNAAKVNSFFRHEKKVGHTYTPEQKTEVIESVLRLSQTQCERALLAFAPETIPSEKIRPLTETRTEIRIVVDEETMAVLVRLRELLSNKIPDASYAQLLDYLAREKVDALEKKLMGGKSEIREPRASTPVGEVELKSEFTPPDGVKNGHQASDRTLNSSHGPNATPRISISVTDRRWAMRRANGQCEHVTESGQRCTSRWRLNVDHIICLALGGKNERDNYRIACRAHNLFYAKTNIGRRIMKKYVASLR